ncbi:Two-component sensor histidine kinase, contains HisKA and HATPase domains [Caenispirillum bisanense]|uniref:histidine kinase n=2 Tax=Caenispirillum bisanense TaxID=414052 RepID=A0A286H0D9_9PROT|nr:Two-component sensor histidine kinase, contains HisKA and HATPase domains [Caenispirillum bisanense]
MPTLEDMLVRQKVTGDFGEFALRSEDLQDILDKACHLVGNALGTRYAKVLEIEADGKHLLVQAGAGWRPGIVGKVRLPMSELSSETYSIERAYPVIVQDIDTEDRFIFPDFLREHGVVSMVNVPIILPGGTPYGLLQVDDVEKRDFGEEDIEFLRTYAAILGPVIDRLHKAHSLRLALETNRRLFGELQHRVKNHISIISSLVSLRMRQAATDDARAELDGLNSRIETLRLVHEQLYAADKAEHVSMRPFVLKLVEVLCDFHESETGRVDLDFEVADMTLDPDVAVPLGMILNEFVVNSLKYAFDGAGGCIRVAVARQDGHVLLRVSDDGKGLPEGVGMATAGSGTGMTLIHGLARQIEAAPSWSSSPAGTSLTLAVPYRM